MSCREHPTERRALSHFTWTLAALLVALPCAASDLEAIVTVGSGGPTLAQTKRALEQCSAHAPELDLKTCIDRYWIPRWLLDAEAAARKLDQSSAVRPKRADILHATLVEKITSHVPTPSDEEIDAYLEQHRRDFEKPLRIRIFRIMVSTKEKAEEVRKQLDATTTLSDFRKLARDHSVDRATSERGGDLGFVWPDGSTDIPQVSAETSLYEAAQDLKDGEFSSQPVPERDHFAVIWRRGTLPATELDESARKIARLRLLERRSEARVREILDKKKAIVRGRNDDLLGKLRRPEASLFREP